MTDSLDGQRRYPMGWAIDTVLEGNGLDGASRSKLTAADPAELVSRVYDFLVESFAAEELDPPDQAILVFEVTERLRELIAEADGFDRDFVLKRPH